MKTKQLFLTDSHHKFILSVLSLFGFYVNFSSQRNLLVYLEQYLPFIVVAILIIYAAYNKKFLFAYIALVMTFFSQSIESFIQAFYHFLEGNTSLDILSTISFLFAILILAIIFYLWYEKEYITLQIDFLWILPFMVFFILFNYLSTAIMMLMLPLLALWLGDKKIGYGFFLSEVIIYPILLIDAITSTFTSLLLIKLVLGSLLCIYALYLNYKENVANLRIE